MRRLGGHVWQRARGGAADARASGIVDRPSRRAPESSEGRDARRTDLVAWPAGLDVAGRGLARGQTLRKSMWVMVSAKTGGPAAVTHRRWRRLRVSAHQRSLISRAHACNISCAYRTIFLDSDAVTRRGAAGPRHGGRARRPLDLATPAGRGAAARAAGSLGPDRGSLVPGRSGRG